MAATDQIILTCSSEAIVAYQVTNSWITEWQILSLLNENIECGETFSACVSRDTVRRVKVLVAHCYLQLITKFLRCTTWMVSLDWVNRDLHLLVDW